MQIRSILLGNMVFKLLALVGAIALWFFITYQGQSETITDASIDFKNIPSGMEILKQNIRRVNVGVRGHEMILSGLRPSDVRVVVDLSNGKKGEGLFSFDVNDVKSPRNVKVKRIDPTSIKVYLDESMSKTFRITPFVIGEPRPGFEVKKITVDPPNVAADGAKTEMARIAALRTEPVDISGLDASISQRIRLDTNGKNIRLKIPEVAIFVGIGKKGK
jgi:YbbR domain-containing protein